MAIRLEIVHGDVLEHKADVLDYGHVVMTLHGRGFGLDEAEAFRAQVAGVLDAVHSREQATPSLRITIVERDLNVVERLKTLLNDIAPGGRAWSSGASVISKSC